MPRRKPGKSSDADPNVPSPEIIREFNDRGTLWLLEDPIQLRDLVQILEPELAAHLEVEHAERINRSFIPADLQKEESDLIFLVPFRIGNAAEVSEVWIYVLVEHQSRPDLLMGLRLLLYMSQLWDLQRREWKDAGRPMADLRLHPILPLVFYTGTDAWTRPLDLSGLMEVPEELRRFVPQWQPLFLNLHRTPPETLTRFATAVGYALRVLWSEQAPLSELESVLGEAMIGLEGLSEEQSGQWLRVAWYLALLVYHRRERPEYDELVQVIVEQAKASKFRERTEVEQVVQSMAQFVAAEAEAHGIAVGEARALRSSVETVLEARFGELSAEIKSALATATMEQLNVWLRLAATALTLDEIGIARPEPPTPKRGQPRRRSTWP
jgi:hypothetical protein